MSEHVVIVGGGVAAFRAAKELRRADDAVEISFFTEEPHPFYLRRQLGDLLGGGLTAGELIVQSRNAYRRERINLFLMTRVAAVRPEGHEVVLDSGQHVRYDRLLIATGTRAEPLELPGADLQGVVTVDNLAAAVLAERGLARRPRAVVLDDSVIGWRLAEGLASRDVAVTLLVPGRRIGEGVLDDGAAAMIESILESGGVAIAHGTAARGIVGAGGRAIAVETAADGEILPAELVVTGGRRRPVIDLVEGSGIEARRGVRVDAALRTNVPDVFAAGDVAEPTAVGLWEPDESPLCWQRAWTQGRLAAAAILGRPVDAVPDVLRLRTVLFGRDLAVLGRGHLAEGDGIEAIVVHGRVGADGMTGSGAADPDAWPGAAPAPHEQVQVYRRLVFDRGRFVGAVLVGPADWYAQVTRLLAERARRAEGEGARGLAGGRPQDGFTVVPQAFAWHCPICAAELAVPRGTAVGSTIRCRACNARLSVRWEGDRGWIEAAGGSN